LLAGKPLRQGRLDLRRAGAFWVSSLALLLAGFLLSPGAQAAYQQVGNFAGHPGELQKTEGTEFEISARWPEEVQLGGVGGMAVNYTGAGGVPAGTIYAATYQGSTRVARYNPDRSFSEAWTVESQAAEEQAEAKGEEPYERCGPEGAAAHPTCVSRVEGTEGNVDVDVDQTTGNVYVFKLGAAAGDLVVTIYNSDGTEVIARFGEMAAAGEHLPEGPARIHGTLPGAIAVNGAGEVYVFDIDYFNSFYHRLMLFKPKTPGDYTEYEYAGQSHDIGAGSLGEYPATPVTDAAGYIYVAAYDHVEKYDPAQPGAPPVCSFFFKKGAITTMTVNPLSGEVFFYSGALADRKVHQLNPCAEGKFGEAQALEVTPARNVLSGMAVDPVRQLDPARAAGILYLGAPSRTGGQETEGKGESSMGYVFAPAIEVAPTVISESIAAVTQSSARLEAVIHPGGNQTRYSFQYISDAAYEANEPGERFAGATQAPTGGALIDGSKNVAASATVGGLQAGSGYRFRVIATSHCAPSEPQKECTAEGADRSFHTYPVEVSGLPDNRAYELVSPAEKNGGQVFPANPKVSSCPAVECKPGAAFNHFPKLSSLDGDAVAYEGNAFSFDVGALIENEYVARRSETGWQSANLTPSLLASKGGAGYKAFSADLGIAVLEQEGAEGLDLTPDSPPGFPNIYTQPSATPLSLIPLLSEAPPNRANGHGNNGLAFSYAGASADFSRLFFGANDALTPEAQGGPEAKTNLYESSGGQLHLVNLAPGNASTLPGAVFGSGKLLKRGDSNIPDVFVFHAISADGSRAFWTSEEDGNLYVREGGQTLEVPDPNSCATSLKPEERTCFISAAADGSKVLLSDGLLFDVENLAAPPVDLTQGQGGFEGLAGQSENLSRAYFADTAALTGEEENGYGDKAQAGKANLYAWHEGETSFIATLPSTSAADWALAPVHRSAAASPDGGWLAFVSEAPLSGFDNTGPCNVVSGTETFLPGPCAEVFLYQADTGELRCPSCNRAGVPPHGPSGLLQPTGSTALPPPRYLTDSGRLFFDSQDSLSPFDTNGRVEDVYELEPAGVGDCTVGAGCVRLISAGDSGIDSNFMTMDPSGKNIFFTSRDRLVKADEDDLIDLYDAREGGGFAPEGRSVECQGETCLSSASAPNYATPASLGFKGPASSKQKAVRRCRKGRRLVRRKGKARCVKGHSHKRHPKHQHSRAHRNRGGAK
jgi:hypothetical protein